MYGQDCSELIIKEAAEHMKLVFTVEPTKEHVPLYVLWKDSKHPIFAAHVLKNIAEYLDELKQEAS